jgi:predicted acyl esterase
MHLRGNIEGFLGVSSPQKWLSLHAGKHWESFYLPQYVAMQKRFFNYFLRDEKNGWDKEPKVKIVVRDPRGDRFRATDSFPIPGTTPQRYYLDAKAGTLSLQPSVDVSEVSYEAMGPGAHFSTAPFVEDVEFTGFVSAKLWVSSSTSDMDIFAVLRALDADGKEIIINGAHEASPVSRGWLRVSQRKLDAVRSNELRPFYAHDTVEKLTPSEVYEVHVEIWPTSMVFPKGYRLVLSVLGRDFEFPGIPGRILHNHPQDRDKDEFRGINRILSGGAYDSYITLPFVPADE